MEQQLFVIALKQPQIEMGRAANAGLNNVRKLPQSEKGKSSKRQGKQTNDVQRHLHSHVTEQQRQVVEQQCT